MNYNLTKPCSNCPFRKDKLFHLAPERIDEIANSQGGFACHKTLDYSGDGRETKTSQHCAGLLIMLEHMEQPHQMMRISERLGLYDHTKLDMDAPVYTDVEEYLEAIEAAC